MPAKLELWVARRSRDKPTWPGTLDRIIVTSSQTSRCPIAVSLSSSHAQEHSPGECTCPAASLELMSKSLGSLGWRVRVLAASMVNCAVCVAIRPVGAVSAPETLLNGSCTIAAVLFNYDVSGACLPSFVAPSLI